MSELWKVVPFLCVLLACPKPGPKPGSPPPLPRERWCEKMQCPAGQHCELREDGVLCVPDQVPPLACVAPAATVPGGPGQQVDTFKEVVRAAQRVYVDERGDPCGRRDPAEIEQTLKGLAEVIQRNGGPCALLLPNDDAVSVREVVNPGPEQVVLWHEHHAVFYATGCFLSNTFRGVHVQQ
jgi:hypothetical protein